MTVPCGGIYGSTKSGLQARWGSDLDLYIPRPPKSKTAIPESVRKKMGLKERRSVSSLYTSATLNEEKAARDRAKGVDPYKIQKRNYLKKGAREEFIRKKSSLTVHRCDIA